MKPADTRFVHFNLIALVIGVVRVSLTGATSVSQTNNPASTAGAAQPAGIVVENKVIATSPVSPLLLRVYIELTNGHEDAILAQMLYGRDFELDRSDLDNNAVMEASKSHKTASPHVSNYGSENWSQNLCWNSSYEENSWYFIHDDDDSQVCLAGVVAAELLILPDRTERPVFAAAGEHYIIYYLNRRARLCNWKRIIFHGDKSMPDYFKTHLTLTGCVFNYACALALVANTARQNDCLKNLSQRGNLRSVLSLGHLEQ